MALMITDTRDGSRHGMPCPGARGKRMQALAVFVRQTAGGMAWR